MRIESGRSDEIAGFWEFLGPIATSAVDRRERGAAINDDGATVWSVARDNNGSIIGCASLRPASRAFVTGAAYVVPERRGQGVYSALLRKQISLAGGRSIRSSARNPAALAALRAEGFVEVREQGSFTVMEHRAR